MPALFIPVTVHPRRASAAAAANSLQSCPTLCDPRDGSPPGSANTRILQARTLEWVANFLLQCMKVKSESEVIQSSLTPIDPMDCSLPGSSVCGICQARVLEWIAYLFSRGSSQPRNQTWVSYIANGFFLLILQRPRIFHIFSPFQHRLSISRIRVYLKLDFTFLKLKSMLAV